MRKIFTPIIIASTLALLSTACQAQITKVADYTNNYSETIGTFMGNTFREAGFSALAVIPGTNGTEFWTCSDRGVNVDCGSANPAGCKPTYDKLFCFPSYAPKIHRVKYRAILFRF